MSAIISCKVIAVTSGFHYTNFIYIIQENDAKAFFSLFCLRPNEIRRQVPIIIFAHAFLPIF